MLDVLIQKKSVQTFIHKSVLLNYYESVQIRSYLDIRADLLWIIQKRGCCLSGTFFYSNYNKRSVIAEKDSVLKEHIWNMKTSQSEDIVV